LLSVYSCLKDQIRQLDRQPMGRARTSAVCQQLMTIPGVGVLTALAFVTAVDDPTKFAKSRSVGAYFGLAPRWYQSGEIDRNRGISKCGDGLVRTYLFEAAGTLLTRVEKWSALKVWGLRLAKRSGLKQRLKEGEDRHSKEAGCHHAPYVGGWRLFPMVGRRTGGSRMTMEVNPKRSVARR
jgi:transposase